MGNRCGELPAMRLFPKVCYYSTDFVYAILLVSRVNSLGCSVVLWQCLPSRVRVERDRLKSRGQFISLGLITVLHPTTELLFQLLFDLLKLLVNLYSSFWSCRRRKRPS